jgi:hypothetical protein
VQLLSGAAIGVEQRRLQRAKVTPPQFKGRRNGNGAGSLRSQDSANWEWIMAIQGRSFTTTILAIGSLLLILAAGCSVEEEVKLGASGSDRPETHATSPGGAPVPVSFVANPFCKACHLDFDEESLVLQHRSAGIGCERCHGESLRHRSDEANITPPEMMYPKARINPTCMMCHPRHEIRHVASHRPILEANLSIFEAVPADGHAAKSCTDCHGRHHRMQVRNVRWDKATGKLLE